MADRKSTPEAVILAASTIITVLPEKSPLAIGHFDKKLTMLTDFSTDRKMSIAESNRLLPDAERWRGTTLLYESVVEAASRFGVAQNGDSIILVTDGDDNQSSKISRLVGALAQKGIRLFFYILRDPSTYDKLELNDNLRDALLQTGGGAIVRTVNLKMSDPFKLAVMYDSLQVASRISNAYSLQVELPLAPAKRTKWQWSIDSKERAYQELKLEYPAYVQPCTLHTP
jgi:hypothetical protein